MGKILALDIGESRIGYAVSDESRSIAFPRATLARKPQAALFVKLSKIVRDESISTILIGIPLGENNEETQSAQKIKKFGALIARAVMRPIEYIDEFGTTREALAKMPLRKTRREKGDDDPIAAQILLQRYLDTFQ